MRKNKNGITLIALIITIIVLLILAGVALATLTGQGNIIGNAENAVGEYKNEANNEQEIINNIDKMLSNYMNGKETETYYTVSFAGNGVSFEDEQYLAGTELTIDKVPTLSGYDFLGWYIDEDCTIPFENGTTIMGNITLYAGWEATSGGGGGTTTRYTVSYKNGVVLGTDTTVEGTEFSAERYARGTVVKLNKQPSAEGFEFVGWYADKECTEPLGDEITIMGSITIYSGWNKL